MITTEKPDVVHILTPPQFRKEIVAFAAKHGCHILLEKPMAVDANEAKAMIKAAQDAGVKLCPMHNHLFDDVVLAAKEMIALGEIGRPTYVESWYGIPFKEYKLVRKNKNHWKYQLPGSIFHDYLPHPTYLLQEFVQDAKVNCTSAKYCGKTPDVDRDELRVMVEGEHQLGTLCLSLSTYPRFHFLKIYGTGGTIKVDFLSQRTVLLKEISFLPRAASGMILALKGAWTNLKTFVVMFFRLLTKKYDLLQGSERLIYLFYRSIAYDEPLPVTPEEGLSAVRFMDSVWKKSAGTS